MAHKKKRRGHALWRRYGHAAAARNAGKRAVALFKKADKQLAQAKKVDSRRMALEQKVNIAQQKCTGVELKLQRQISTLRAKAADLRNEESANRALAETLQRQVA